MKRIVALLTVCFLLAGFAMADVNQSRLTLVKRHHHEKHHAHKATKHHAQHRHQHSV